VHIAHLSLANYRNIDSAEVALSPGLTIVHGANAQGKSNLLEAVYLLATARSYRAQSERELIAWSAPHRALAMLAAKVRRADGFVDVRVGLQAGEGETVRKQVRVNGVPNRASDLVGVLNAVLFSAEDLDLVYGSPQGRRRYVDVMLSQTSPAYLRALQRYQRVLTQRNALLRNLRDGRAREDELAYWDGALKKEAAVILAARHAAIQLLAPLAAQAFERLAVAGERFVLTYAPTAPTADATTAAALSDAMQHALERTKAQERAMAQTVVGPHRDDIRLTLHGQEMARHASRGQARMGALAMRLAEARFLAERRHDAPVLLLDDILSELDPERRLLVMAETSRYPQTLLTTADLRLVPDAALAGARLLRIAAGRVDPD